MKVFYEQKTCPNCGKFCYKDMLIDPRGFYWCDTCNNYYTEEEVNTFLTMENKPWES